MHNAALAELRLPDWHYGRLPVPPELFAEVVAALPQAGFVGANVTVPHKEAALRLADDATPTARAIGAANTLTFRADGSVHADNTDAPGLLAVLPADVRGATALVLGAGGSARAAVYALREAGAGEVRVLNRTPGRARVLADELGAVAVTSAAPAGLLVNATTVGLHDPDEQPAADPAHFGAIVDLVYRDGGTALVRAAHALAIPTADGIDVLVAQGALSLEHWTGCTASRETMRVAARRS